jgi:hypothetical protein
MRSTFAESGRAKGGSLYLPRINFGSISIYEPETLKRVTRREPRQFANSGKPGLGGRSQIMTIKTG